MNTNNILGVAIQRAHQQAQKVYSEVRDYTTVTKRPDDPVDAFRRPACFLTHHVSMVTGGGKHGKALCALAAKHVNNLREEVAQVIRDLPGTAADTPNRVRVTEGFLTASARPPSKGDHDEWLRYVDKAYEQVYQQLFLTIAVRRVALRRIG